MLSLNEHTRNITKIKSPIWNVKFQDKKGEKCILSKKFLNEHTYKDSCPKKWKSTGMFSYSELLIL